MFLPLMRASALLTAKVAAWVRAIDRSDRERPGEDCRGEIPHVLEKHALGQRWGGRNLALACLVDSDNPYTPPRQNGL
jgi:hypothetical protein